MLCMHISHNLIAAFLLNKHAFGWDPYILETQYLPSISVLQLIHPSAHCTPELTTEITASALTSSCWSSSFLDVQESKLWQHSSNLRNNKVRFVNSQKFHYVLIGTCHGRHTRFFTQYSSEWFYQIKVHVLTFPPFHTLWQRDPVLPKL